MSQNQPEKNDSLPVEEKQFEKQYILHQKPWMSEILDK